MHRYAHRAFKHVLITEINATGSSSKPIALSDDAFNAMVDGGEATSPDCKLTRMDAHPSVKDAKVCALIIGTSKDYLLTSTSLIPTDCVF